MTEVIVNNTLASDIILMGFGSVVAVDIFCSNVKYVFLSERTCPVGLSCLFDLTCPRQEVCLGIINRHIDGIDIVRLVVSLACIA